jgi:hypothetical protein
MSTPPFNTFTCICKIAYFPLADDNDEVTPGNLGAIRLGLEALQKEDAGDLLRAGQLWDEGRRLLAEESEDDVGAASEGKVQVEDDFELGCLGGEGGWGYGGYGYEW